MSNSYLRLSREGVFPITVNADGTPAANATGMSIPGTIQGEGKLAGTSALFVRLQGCNLRCHWTLPDGSPCLCDTAHTWRIDGGDLISVDDIVRTIDLNIGEMRHLVITGGEPYMQPDGLQDLLLAMEERGIHTTVETNGIYGKMTKMGGMPLANLTSISPKLSSSGLDEEGVEMSAQGTGILVHAAKRAHGDVQIKFVVSRPEDEVEIKEFFALPLRLVKPSDVIVMPLGATITQLAETQKVALDMALRNGWRFGPRLHINLFGNKEGT